MTPDQIIAQHKKLTAMSENLTRNVYLTIHQVMEILNASRQVVEGIPFDVLPFVNLTPGSPRTHRRYHPDDVSVALRVLLPRYQEARAAGKGSTFLTGLREERKKYEDAMLAQSRQEKVA